jgi:hypothetical protein
MYIRRFVAVAVAVVMLKLPEKDKGPRGDAIILALDPASGKRPRRAAAERLFLGKFGTVVIFVLRLCRTASSTEEGRAEKAAGTEKRPSFRPPGAAAAPYHPSS